MKGGGVILDKWKWGVILDYGKGWGDFRHENILVITKDNSDKAGFGVIARDKEWRDQRLNSKGWGDFRVDEISWLWDGW